VNTRGLAPHVALYTDLRVVKRFGKEKDKLLERLSKIVNSKPTAQFACSNLNASMTLGVFEKGYLDIALEDAENA